MTATITPKVEQTAPAVTTAASKGWRRFVPRIFGTILWLVAIICALAAIGRAFRSGMQPIRQTLDVLLVPAPANLAYAVFLAMLATATLSRKRVAWWFLTVYFIVERGRRRVPGLDSDVRVRRRAGRRRGQRPVRHDGHRPALGEHRHQHPRAARPVPRQARVLRQGPQGQLPARARGARRAGGHRHRPGLQPRLRVPRHAGKLRPTGWATPPSTSWAVRSPST